MTTYNEANITIQNADGIDLLGTIADKSVDLAIIDPPYIISRDSGMNALFNQVKEQGDTNMKTDDDWNEYLTQKTAEIDADTGMTEEERTDKKTQLASKKDEYIKYGSIYGKKYSVQTDYGDWDSNFTMEKLEEFIRIYYRKLRTGGTLIIFFDLWKITNLHAILERNKFKQIRFIEWIKTNPQPLNSKTNYLTNCREIALVAVKGGKPTFNSQYDNGIYQFPLQGGKQRFHPTQKQVDLVKALIEKHSNPGDLVVDTFLGSGTTAVAAKETGRRFIGCEISPEYYDKIVARISS